MAGLFWVIVLASFIALSTSSKTHHTQKQTYIIRVNTDAKPSVFLDVRNWYSSTLKSLKSSSLDADGEEYDQDLLHVYASVFHGFSAKLSSSQAFEIKKRSEVLDVIPDRVRQLHTTRSPQFLGLTSTRQPGLLEESDYGSNVIIGVIDSGIWPERRSFHDEELGPVPTRWKGECVEGNGFNKSNCNNKVIGARFFLHGYEAAHGPINGSDFRSARDSHGHGTHTASTAAGRVVDVASMLGLANGTATGIAPKARIATYKVCWPGGCFTSDILAGVDSAVADGVDIISISIGTGASVEYHLDPIAIGYFGAAERGVFVSASAGNDGPVETTVTNIAPWITTVGAGTIDRNFPADIVLGNGKIIKGVSLYTGSPLPPKQLFPLVYAGNVSAGRGGVSALCMDGSLDPGAVRGRIVFCEDGGGIPRVAKGEVVRKAGGAGMILANSFPNKEGPIADAHVLPTVAIGEMAGYELHAYIATSVDPRCTLTFYGTQLNVKPAPVLASFSSRGPNMVSPYIIKPDIIAPGVEILAAWTDSVGPTELSSDQRRTEFNIMSGTSMSCPHLSGIAALLRGVHPDWSPAAVRSALMTTAYVHDNVGTRIIDAATGNASNVWDVGSGHVDPEKAVDPGLVYDLTVDDYLRFLCDSNYTEDNIRSISHRVVSCRGNGTRPWDLNYPSISVVFDESTVGWKEIEVRRSVMNVGDGAAVYEVKVKSPDGTQVMVDPTRLEFGGKGDKKSYVVRISAIEVKQIAGSSRSEFGVLTWTDRRHMVSSPIAVTWQKPS